MRFVLFVGIHLGNRLSEYAEIALSLFAQDIGEYVLSVLFLFVTNALKVVQPAEKLFACNALQECVINRIVRLA